MTEEKLSDWFEGELYKEGAEVTNRFSGEKITLNAEELSVYDFIMGSQMFLEMKLEGDDKLESSDVSFLRKTMDKGVRWFRTTNPKAHKILLE
jgi:hypothetical protein